MTSHTREVVTLQLGHYANFVGTHWWNIQESSFVYTHTTSPQPKELNHDVLFREGSTLAGEVTYTPRLVAVDLKGSLNTLRQGGNLYEVQESEDDLQWHSDVTLHKTESLPKNEFLRDLEKEEELYLRGKTNPDASTSSAHEDEQESEKDKAADEAAADGATSEPVFGTKLYNLDSKVQVWSDYLRTHLHPRSVHVVEQYQHGNELEPFDIYFLGEQLWKDRKTHCEIEDRLHFFLEECDNIQGIHLLVDPTDGFGGLAASVLEELDEDYGNKGLMVCAVHPAFTKSITPYQDCYRVFNSALAYEKLISHSSLFTPMSMAGKLWRLPKEPISFQHLQYQHDLPYHSSAMLAACLDTMTLPYRLESQPSLMTHMIQALTPLSRKVSCLQAALPFPMSSHDTLVDMLMSLGDALPWQPLTPMCQSEAVTDGQSVVLRGVPTTRLKGSPGPDMPRVLSQCTDMEEMVQLYLKQVTSSVSAVCTLQQPIKTTAPFPHIFSSAISASGWLSEKPRSQTKGVSTIPMMTSLQSTCSVGNLLEHLLEETGKLNIKKFHKFLEAGMEEDDFKETLNNLKTLRQNYEQGAGNMA